MSPFRRFLPVPTAWITLGLISVTFFSKFVGFIRELLLLSEVGLTAELDSFLLLLIASTVITGIGTTLVFTNATPLAYQTKDDDGLIALILEGVKVGTVFFILACVINFSLTFSRFQQGYTLTFYVIMPLSIASISFFTILGEYQAAIFTAKAQRAPVIFGNIIVSAPLIIAFIVLDLTIVAYANGMALSFALRSVVWIFILRLRPSDNFTLLLAWCSPVKLLQNTTKTIVGGSAMVLLQLMLMVLMMAAQDIGEGAVAAFSYSFRLPYLLITTVWFVFGLRFFSNIVTRNDKDIIFTILSLTGMNAAAGILLSIACLMYLLLFPNFTNVPLLGNPDYAVFVALSFWAMPICLFYPIVEMFQRGLVVSNNHYRVGFISTVILGFVILWIGILPKFTDIRVFLGYITITSAAAALVALLQSRYLYRV